MATEAEQLNEDPLKHVISSGIYYNGLSIGIKQSIKSIEARDAQICILAKDCDQKNYVNLVTALCNEAKIPIYKNQTRKKIGEMLGLCKVDRDGKPRKICGCSCFIVKNLVNDTHSINACKKLASL